MGWSFERVYLVRHGETEWNVAGRRQGRLDSPLTPLGIGHAQVAAETLASSAVDGVFASPVGRARRTAEIVGAELGLEVQVVDDLAELDHGAYAGLTDGEIDAAHPGELARRNAHKYTWRFPDGESYEDVDARARRALDAVAATGARSPALVSHEMVGRMLLRALLGLSPDDALDRSLPHGTVVEVVPLGGPGK